jgi:hypothetical protein
MIQRQFMQARLWISRFTIKPLEELLSEQTQILFLFFIELLLIELQSQFPVNTASRET